MDPLAEPMELLNGWWIAPKGWNGAEKTYWYMGTDQTSSTYDRPAAAYVSTTGHVHARDDAGTTDDETTGRGARRRVNVEDNETRTPRAEDTGVTDGEETTDAALHTEMAARAAALRAAQGVGGGGGAGGAGGRGTTDTFRSELRQDLQQGLGMVSNVLEEKLKDALATIASQIAAGSKSAPPQAAKPDALLRSLGMSADPVAPPKCALDLSDYSCAGACSAQSAQPLGSKFCAIAQGEAVHYKEEMKEYALALRKTTPFAAFIPLVQEHAKLSTTLREKENWTGAGGHSDESHWDKQGRLEAELRDTQLTRELNSVIGGPSRYGGMGARRDGAQENLSKALQAQRLGNVLKETWDLLGESLDLIEGEDVTASVRQNITASRRAIGFVHDLVKQGEFAERYEVHKALARTQFEVAIQEKQGVESCLTKLEERARGGGEGPVGYASPMLLRTIVGQILTEMRDSKAFAPRQAGEWAEQMNTASRQKKDGGGGAAGGGVGVLGAPIRAKPAAGGTSE
jgi:hypothetical protein